VGEAVGLAVGGTVGDAVGDAVGAVVHTWPYAPELPVPAAQAVHVPGESTSHDVLTKSTAQPWQSRHSLSAVAFPGTRYSPAPHGAATRAPLSAHGVEWAAHGK
jgi:hypothetical protein